MLPTHTLLRSASLTLAILLAAAHATPAVAQQSELQYVLCVESVAGPGVGSDFPGCAEVSALGLSVRRQMKESGEKGGTADINIGVGELSPIAIRKPSDGTSALFFKYAINGNSMGDAAVYVLEQREGWSQPLATMEVRLGRSFVQSFELDASNLVEKLEIYYNKIQLTTIERDSNGKETFSSEQCWDKVNQQASCSL